MGLGKFKSLFIEESDATDKFADLLGDEPVKPTKVTKVTEVELSEIELGEYVVPVEDIYDTYGLSISSEKSIFKIEDIKAVLPDTLSTTAKKESVIGMLKISGIEVEDVLGDADSRVEVLNKVKENVIVEADELIAKSNDSIQQLQDRLAAQIQEINNAIDIAKEVINNAQIRKEQQSEIVEKEITKIDSIIKFIS